MSEDDPFGRRDRTIIAPNPGGRRPPLPQAPPPGSGAGPPPGAPPTYDAPPREPPRAAPTYSPPPAYPPPPNPFQQPPQPAGWGQPTPAGRDAWMDPGAARPLYQTPTAPEPIMPRTSGQAPARMDLFAANRNELLRAAAPLLLLLGRLRTSLSRGSYAHLMDQVTQAIQQYEIDLREAGVPEDKATLARYALSATADDIVQNIPSDDRHLWAQYSMLARFFGERTGGVRFFTELDRAKTSPIANQDVLELMHACLCLGFEGIHRTSAGGAGTLQGIQRDVYETLRRVRSREVEELSPNWRGQEIAKGRHRLVVPPWSVAAVAGVLLIGLFFALRALLGYRSEALAASMAALHPTTDIAIARDPFTPPPPAFEPPANGLTQIERIRGAVAAEIADGRIAVDQTANVILIRVGNLALFDSGKATVKEAFKPVAERIAAALEREPGAIRIVGHTDNVPTKKAGAFASNFELSKARADAVAALIGAGVSDQSRLVVEGKGEDQPIAKNNTAEGRALNRRVEILIPRAD